MPGLHRYLGTPILTAMINLLFGSKLTDCNSGFRAFRRDRLPAWHVSSPGMEFASELLVNALRAGAKIVEVPITLRSDQRHRQPHLHTWRDGMRHLLTILARAAWLFLHGGLAIVVLSLLIATMCAFGPRLVFARFTVFDYHTLIFAALLGFLGTQVFGTGLLLQLRDRDRSRGLWHNSSTCMKGSSSGSSPALSRVLSEVLASLPGVGRSMALLTLPI